MLKRNDEEIFVHHVHKIQGCSVKNETFRSLGRGHLVIHMPVVRLEVKEY